MLKYVIIIRSITSNPFLILPIGDAFIRALLNSKARKPQIFRFVAFLHLW